MNIATKKTQVTGLKADRKLFFSYIEAWYKSLALIQSFVFCVATFNFLSHGLRSILASQKAKKESVRALLSFKTRAGCCTHY